MQTITIGLDLAKNVFQVHGVDGAGAVTIRKKLRRAEVMAFFRKLPSALLVWRPARRRTTGRGSWQRWAIKSV